LDFNVIPLLSNLKVSMVQKVVGEERGKGENEKGRIANNCWMTREMERRSALLQEKLHRCLSPVSYSSSLLQDSNWKSNFILTFKFSTS